MGMPVNPIWDQQDYAFYQSNGTTIIGSAGTQQTLEVDTTYYVRLAIGDTNNANATGAPADLTCNFQYNLAAGGWNDVTTSTPLQFANGSLTDGGSITSSTLTAIGSFNNGRVYESDSDATVVYTLPGDETDSYTEVMLGFTIDSAQVSDGQEILVRATFSGGTVYDNYTDADIDVNEAAAAYTLDADTTAYSVTAAVVALEAGSVLDAATTAYSVTAADVSFDLTRAILADTTAYSVSASNITLEADRILDADTTAYSITGGDITFQIGKTLDIDPASYSVSALDISFDLTRNITVDSASYSVAGTDVELDVGYQLDADVAVYSISAADVSLEYGRVLDAGSGSYTVTGLDVSLDYGGLSDILDADGYAYSVTAADIGMEAGFVLAAGPASYSVTAADIDLEETETETENANIYDGFYSRKVLENRRKQHQEFIKQQEAEQAKAEKKARALKQALKEDEVIMLMVVGL